MDVLGRLRREIELRELPPGTRLFEPEIAKRYAVDPLSVRQAIELLVQEDLARHYPGRGAFVAELSVPDLIEYFQMQEALESASALLAAEAVRLGKPVTVLVPIREDVATLREHLGDADSSAYRAVAHSIQRTLASLAGNRMLTAALENLWAQRDRVEHHLCQDFSRILTGVDEYAGIIECVMEGDAAAAREAMSRHVRLDCEAVVREATAPPSEAASS